MKSGLSLLNHAMICQPAAEIKLLIPNVVYPAHYLPNRHIPTEIMPTEIR